MKRRPFTMIMLGSLAFVPSALAQTSSGGSGQPVTTCTAPAVVPGQPEPPATCVPGVQDGSSIQPAQASNGSTSSGGGASGQPVTICTAPAVVPGQPEPPATCVPGVQRSSAAPATASPATPTAARSLALTG
jgi:hypothetical protein